jgi:hypothetical protein
VIQRDYISPLPAARRSSRRADPRCMQDAVTMAEDGSWRPLPIVVVPPLSSIPSVPSLYTSKTSVLGSFKAVMIAVTSKVFLQTRLSAPTVSHETTNLCCTFYSSRLLVSITLSTKFLLPGTTNVCIGGSSYVYSEARSWPLWENLLLSGRRGRNRVGYPVLHLSRVIIWQQNDPRETEGNREAIGKA